MTIDMTNYKHYFMGMTTTSVAEMKKHLSSLIALVQNGEEVEVRKRNVPVAHLVGIPQRNRNRTRLGCGKGTGRILGDLTESPLPPDSWNMLRSEP